MQDMGPLAGLKRPQMQQQLHQANKNADEYLKLHGGETSTVFKTRVFDFYNDLVIESLVEPHYDFMDTLEQDASAAASKSGLDPKQPPVPRISEEKDPADVTPTPNTTPIQGSLPSVDICSPTSSTPSQPPTVVATTTHAPLNKSHSTPAHSHSSRLTPPLTITTHSSTTITSFPSPSRRSPSFQLPHPLLTPTAVIPPHTTTTATMNKHPKRPRFPLVNILLVTHGGVVSSLFKHLTQDLGFIQPATALSHRGGDPRRNPPFPKSTGVYRFVVSKKFWRDGEYEWCGGVEVENDVSHWAGMVDKYGGDGEKKGKKKKEEVAVVVGGRVVLPGLPGKVEVDGYWVDESSRTNPTPHVSPEGAAPPVVVKRSLGW
ncbi:hypothetical protein HDU98_008872 [Podochytrium sp. JEL0797]|nr:hypothetical protein HDU98_008872 [Podochytrium sp. JEL0797]